MIASLITAGLGLIILLWFVHIVLLDLFCGAGGCSEEGMVTC